MTFTVETGTGSATANSYAATATADNYFADRGGNDAWSAASTTQKEGALVRATDYLDSVCAFLGSRAVAGQALQWPRVGVTDWTTGQAISSSSVPVAVVRATCELAARVMAGEDLLPDQKRGGRIASVKVGSVAVDYAEDAPTMTVYSALGILRGLMVPADPDAVVGVSAEFTGSDIDGADAFFTRGSPP